MMAMALSEVKMSVKAELAIRRSTARDDSSGSGVAKPNWFRQIALSTRATGRFGIRYGKGGGYSRNRHGTTGSGMATNQVSSERSASELSSTALRTPTLTHQPAEGVTRSQSNRRTSASQSSRSHRVTSNRFASPGQPSCRRNAAWSDHLSSRSSTPAGHGQKARPNWARSAGVLAVSAVVEDGASTSSLDQL